MVSRLLLLLFLFGCNRESPDFEIVGDKWEKIGPGTTNPDSRKMRVVEGYLVFDGDSVRGKEASKIYFGRHPDLSPLLTVWDHIAIEDSGTEKPNVSMSTSTPNKLLKIDASDGGQGVLYGWPPPPLIKLNRR